MGEPRKIERAIISVTDKAGIVDFARGLVSFGVEILSTGGTARVLRDGGVDVLDISEFTGFPEILDGRVKTLHPKVHGGILGMRDNPEHVRTMKEHGIRNIDLVAVNLYQFEKTVSKEGVTLEEAVENIDIGGPTMLRSSAKNYRDVTVIVDPADYGVVLREMEENQGGTTLATRFRLAKKVFRLTHEYDGAITRYLEGVTL
ncbi:MAG: IMP cyclohydrolase [Deltaproteobacteria bacterium]|nr:IMP cyclohydrolase [Deltaproteobacteria bacterium]MBW2016398.1 IMP cyclohydrolase [Deltaproteobacteria bacterium]MBW2129702.1 IMP cyclohydrolase [Deltaproteobacteria bacterium]MBW2305132.1 IMP cyclohydrolase [Deltaproteobacteria bacterium]